MAFSEASFNSRLENSRRLVEQLKMFNSYAPLSDESSIASFEKLIAETADCNNNATNKIDNYSNDVELRQQLYTKSPDALTKLLSPLASTVRSMYGKNAKQSETITALVTKIRGNKETKPKKTANEKRISQSQRCFSNMAQGLKDIIAILNEYRYEPANPKITLKALENLYQNLSDANRVAAVSYTAQKQACDKRLQQYELLTKTTQRIKNAVKSQYGIQSTEYKVVKGLKV